MKLLSGWSQGEVEVDPASVSRDTNRLVTFSDSVFATVTLLVLEIRPPTRTAVVFYGIALRPDGADVQRCLAVRTLPQAAQRRPRPGGRCSDQQAISAHSGLARGRRPVWRSAACLGRHRYRHVQRLLLTPDPWGEPSLERRGMTHHRTFRGGSTLR